MEEEKSLERTFGALGKISQYENFHVLEHILLRPKMPPRQRNNRRGAAHEDSDTVRLLPALTIPPDTKFTETEQADAPFKFNIINVPDPNDNNRILWRLGVSKDDSSEVLKVEQTFLFHNDLTRRIANIKETGADGSNYEISDSADGYYIFKIIDRGTELAVSRKSYRKKEDIESEIEKLVEFFSYESENAQEENVDSDLSS
jgi:hypothetical protein